MDVAPRVLWMPGRVRTEIHLDGRDTGGAFCMLIDYPPAGWSLPAHSHRGAAETIHILHGEFEMAIGGEQSRLVAGRTAHIAAGVVHAGANVGSEPGQRVVVFSPAGMEDFFLEVGASAEGIEIEPRAALAAAIRHGWQLTRPAEQRASDSSR